MKENIVFLFADQLRSDFLGCYGADFVKTPNIDKIASDGLLYKRTYSTSPTCIPARASLLTGMNAISNGVIGNSDWLRSDMDKYGIKTWPQYLNKKGYLTAAVGKMHFYPWDTHMGFRYRVICEDKRWIKLKDDYYKFLREHGYDKYHGNDVDGYHEGKGAMINPIPWEYSVDHFVGLETCKFIDTYGSDGPFALMVGFPGPHGPYDPTQQFLDDVDESKIPDPIDETEHTAMFRRGCISGNRNTWNGIDYEEFTYEQKMKVRKHYIALIQQIDYEVGQIIELLKEKDLYDKTTVIFAADHGDYVGDYGLVGKGSFLEPSCRVPLIVKRADSNSAKTYDGLVKLMDVTSTLLTIADIPVPNYMDSTVLPELGYDARTQDKVYGMNNGGWMVFDGEYKLSKYARGVVHLFNLTDDPHEEHNLIDDPKYHDKFMELDRLLTDEIIRSITKSNYHQSIDDDNMLWNSDTYCYEGVVPTINRMRIEK